MINGVERFGDRQGLEMRQELVNPGLINGHRVIGEGDSALKGGGGGKEDIDSWRLVVRLRVIGVVGRYLELWVSCLVHTVLTCVR